MARKLSQPERTKAIVNAAWDHIKVTNVGVAPSWNYIGLCAMVDSILTTNNIDDGRDLGDAIVLCHELEQTPTKKVLLLNMGRVAKGRQGRVWVA